MNQGMKRDLDLTVNHNENKKERWRKGLIPMEPMDPSIGKTSFYPWTLQILMYLS